MRLQINKILNLSGKIIQWPYFSPIQVYHVTSSLKLGMPSMLFNFVTMAVFMMTTNVFLNIYLSIPLLVIFCSKTDLSWLNYLEYCQTYESVLNSHHLLSEQTNVFFRFIWVIKIRARFKKHNWSDTNDELEVRSEKYIAMFLDLLIQIKFWLSFA